MFEQLKYCQSYAAVIIILLMPMSWAQRPSFAGSRPANGLNQKDKYFSTTPSNADIGNRFGSVSTIASQIPFGKPQKPPVGYPVVLPEPVYVTIKPSNLMSSNDTATSVVFEDRFGNTDKNAIPSLSASPNIPPTTQQAAVPLDAHGDQLLIDRLNRTPIDKRPFWFINYLAIEAQRNGTVSNFAGAQSSKGSFSG